MVELVASFCFSIGFVVTLVIGIYRFARECKFQKHCIELCGEVIGYANIGRYNHVVSPVVQFTLDGKTEDCWTYHKLHDEGIYPVGSTVSLRCYRRRSGKVEARLLDYNTSSKHVSYGAAVVCWAIAGAFLVLSLFFLTIGLVTSTVNSIGVVLKFLQILTSVP